MWLKSHLDDHDLVVIDGRGVVAYSSGHIKNALQFLSNVWIDTSIDNSATKSIIKS